MSRLCRAERRVTPNSAADRSEQRAFGRDELGTVIAAREQMAVTIRGHVNRGVTETGLHDLDAFVSRSFRFDARTE